MGIRIWHQSFTVLQDLPAYAAALRAHFSKIARPDTEIVLHGMHPGTYQTNYPGDDIRYAYFQSLHAHQFVLAGLAAQGEGYDAYAVSTLPDPALGEIRSLLDIPVVGYGESAMLTACTVGRKFGVLVFIEQLAPLIEENVRRYGLRERFAGARHVGFRFGDVLKAFEQPQALIGQFREAARALLRDGADVIIPGEAPLCVLLARNGVSGVDGAAVLDALGAWVKMAEALVDLRRASGLAASRRGYFCESPPAERVRELHEFYGLARLRPREGQ